MQARLSVFPAAYFYGSILQIASVFACAMQGISRKGKIKITGKLLKPKLILYYSCIHSK